MTWYNMYILKLYCIRKLFCIWYVNPLILLVSILSILNIKVKHRFVPRSIMSRDIVERGTNRLGLLLEKSRNLASAYEKCTYLYYSAWLTHRVLLDTQIFWFGILAENNHIVNISNQNSWVSNLTYKNFLGLVAKNVISS